VSLNILHGEKIAIVGPNGCGKTTLVSLLPRLLVPDAGGGRVIIDGHDVAEFDLRSLRRQIGVVTQETVLFRGSIASNIAFGMPDATRERIIDAARRAHADEFIRQIPNGYDADVAEQGASLSGGQRQRLAIARAIMRDPSILILDEATSQIDAESEMHINAALREFGRGRTALVIAHRLSTVLHADRIVVMEGGAIIDVGRHDQLLERCELYRRLSKTQLVAVESAD
jgi:ABC-type multidrug transport system fused ATPase/permease subunit